MTVQQWILDEQKNKVGNVTIKKSYVQMKSAFERVVGMAGRHTQIYPAYAVHRANSSSVASTLWVPATVCSCPTA